jgi:hypothetical protein
MSKKISFLVITLLFLCIFVSTLDNAEAQKAPTDTMTLGLANAKMPLVTFSHGNHSKTIGCATCHHKDKDPAKTEKCDTCHPAKEVKEKAIPITDAFHTQCQVCHKENAAKGRNAPTKCNDCHKK